MRQDAQTRRSSSPAASKSRCTTAFLILALTLPLSAGTASLAQVERADDPTAAEPAVVDEPDSSGRPAADAFSDPALPGNRVAAARVPVEGDMAFVRRITREMVGRLLSWYRETPAGDRVAWGGLVACSILGVSVVLERNLRLRRRRVIPPDFIPKFLDRLHDGGLDGGKALDYCEMNPSPAARVALAAVRRWGRPPADLERAVSLAHRVESDRLWRNVGTLRRIVALAPLLGLLGLLMAAGRSLAALGSRVPDGVVSAADWGPALAASLSPLTTGVVIATLALVAYDALVVRIEKLAGSLDRLGAETIDAIAMSAPLVPVSLAIPAARPDRLEETPGSGGSSNVAARTPHQPLSRRADDPGDRLPSRPRGRLIRP
jgi:biopolymer transport protein ExbB